MKRAVVILSGGLDSTVSAAFALRQGYELTALHLSYSQKAQDREKRAFLEVCDALNIKNRKLIELDFLPQLAPSALFKSGQDLEKKSIKDEELKAVVAGILQGKDSKNPPSSFVAFRNGIFLSLAASLAYGIKARAIFTGLVFEDASAYPDCSPGFLQAANAFIKEGLARDIQIISPLLHLKKSEIIKLGLSLNAPLELSYSCYEGGEEACQECESCLIRREGFLAAL